MKLYVCTTGGTKEKKKKSRQTKKPQRLCAHRWGKVGRAEAQGKATAPFLLLSEHGKVE